MLRSQVEDVNGEVHYRGIVFAVEPWAKFWSDAQPLLVLHYKEVGALDAEYCWKPIESEYAQAAAKGALIVTSARTADGTLVGYQLSTLVQHPHYAGLLCAFEDAFFLHPNFRLGWTGVYLIKSALHFLQKRGAKKAFFQSNQLKPTDKLFKALGFVHTHTTYSKKLGE